MLEELEPQEYNFVDYLKLRNNMNKAILINSKTRCVHSIVLTITPVYEENVDYGGCIAISPNNLTENISDEEFYTQWHYTNEWVKHSKSPNDDYVFDVTTLMWQEPEEYLEVKKVEHTNTINGLASMKILDVYPIYRQLNIERESSEETKITMHSYIDAVRGFANAAKVSIESAISVLDIESATTLFVDNLQLI